MLAHPRFAYSRGRDESTFFVSETLFFVHLVNGAGVRAAREDFSRRVPTGRAWVEGAGHGGECRPTALHMQPLRSRTATAGFPVPSAG